MLTFSQFLTEVFLTGVDGRFGYSEIYVNPTSSELRELAHEDGGQVGGILTAKNFYAFDRNGAEHIDAAHSIPKLPSDWIPLYLYYAYNARPRQISLTVAAFSSLGRSLSVNNDAKLMKFAKAHRAFKGFNLVTRFKY